MAAAKGHRTQLWHEPGMCLCTCTCAPVLTCWVPALPTGADHGEGWRRNIRLRRGSELACSGRARGARKRPHLQDFGELALCEAAIASLPVDLLVHVFCHLDQRAHRFVLPLVCRHWCALASYA